MGTWLRRWSSQYLAGWALRANLATRGKKGSTRCCPYPATRLYVLGLVPSPGKRFARIADLRRTNELLQRECAAHPWMRFIDTTSPLLGADGQPKPKCFIPGDIHMTPSG